MFNGKVFKNFEEMVESFEFWEGFFDVYWDDKEGIVYLVIDVFDEEFFFVLGFVVGVGFNDIGFDCG